MGCRMNLSYIVMAVALGACQQRSAESQDEGGAPAPLAANAAEPTDQAASNDVGAADEAAAPALDEMHDTVPAAPSARPNPGDWQEPAQNQPKKKSRPK